MPLTHRKHERRKPRVEGRAEISSRLDELFDHRDVTFDRRPQECRLAPPWLLGMQIGAAGQKHTHRINLAGARCRHQHGLAARQRGIRVRAGIEKSGDDGGVTVLAGDRQRRDTVAVRDAHVGTCPKQLADKIDIVVIGRPVERGGAVRLRRVDADLLVEQLANGGPIVPLHGGSE